MGPGLPTPHEASLTLPGSYRFLPAAGTAGSGAPTGGQLRSAGLDPALRTDATAAECRLEVPALNLEGLNLAALRGAARAHPGSVIELAGSGGEVLARALAVAAGEAPAGLAGAAAWRLVPGNRPPLLLLDRDGTLIEDRHYLADPDGVALLPGAGAALLALGGAGVRFVILTNQSGVGRGLVTAEQMAAVHARLERLLGEAGVTLSGIFSCPHTPEECCGCRKPEPGLAQQAGRELGLDIRRSLVVGDRAADLGLARRLRVPGVLVLTGQGRRTLTEAGALPDFVADDLPELARMLLHPAGFPIPHPVPGETTASS